MVKEIIRDRQRVEEVSYSLHFDSIEDPSCGFCFPCDEKGNVLIDQMHECAVNNYNMCLQSVGTECEKPYIRKDIHRYTECAVAICEMCGNEIELWDEYLGASECPHCHTWHNMFGQTLTNPNYWDNDYDY